MARKEVNALAYEWQIDYKSNHPHKSLNGQSPWLHSNEITNEFVQ